MVWRLLFVPTLGPAVLTLAGQPADATCSCATLVIISPCEKSQSGVRTGQGEQLPTIPASSIPFLHTGRITVEQVIPIAVPDLVNWQAHGLDQPQWSHRDGSSLCPVIGPSGGYQPAQPRPAEPEREPDADVARLDPPATMGSAFDRPPHPDGPAVGGRDQAGHSQQ